MRTFFVLAVLAMVITGFMGTSAMALEGNYGTIPSAEPAVIPTPATGPAKVFDPTQPMYLTAELQKQGIKLCAWDLVREKDGDMVKVIAPKGAVYNGHELAEDTPVPVTIGTSLCSRVCTGGVEIVCDYARAEMNGKWVYRWKLAEKKP